MIRWRSKVTRPQEKSSCIRGHPPSSLSPGREKILFVRQYRYAVEQPLLEIPAGKLDGGEDPDTCAARELTEETGYKTEHMEKLGYVYTTPGFCNEIIHLYLADHLVKAHQHLDQDEFLDVIRLPIDKVYQMVDRGEIYDAKTLAALAMARKKLEMRN